MLKDSFKRGLGYQFARLIITLAIAFIIALLTGKVHAEVDFDFKDEQALWNANKSASVQISNVNTSGGFHQVANIYFDTNYTNTNGYKYAVFYGTWLFFNSGNASYTYDLRLLTVQMNAQSGTGKASNCFFDGGTRLICPMTKDTTYTKISIYLPFNYNIDSSTTGSGGRVATVLYFNYTFIRFVQFGNDQLSSGESAINDSVKETNKSIKETNDYIKDDSDANVDVSKLGGINGLLPAGPLDSLLALPINLITLLQNSTSGSCTPFTFNFVFDSEWTLPCFDEFWNQVPSALLLFLSDLPAVYIFIKWAKSIYKRVEKAVSFESSVEDEWGGV